MYLKNCDIIEFAEKVKSNRFFCFGASEMPEEMCEQYTQYHFENNIAFFVDNDSRKWGEKKILCGREILIISPNMLMKEYAEGDILLITSRFYIDIYEQLQKEERMRNAGCYIWPLIAPQYPSDDCLTEKIRKMEEKDRQIPKILHYFWFGQNRLPELEQKCLETWRQKCPDYEMIRWDESNYDISKNRYMRQAYEAKRWGFVPDYARLDVVYRYGGIYLDTDVEILRCLDPLLNLSAFAGFESKKIIAMGLGFGARKGHPFLKRLMEDYENREFLKGENSFDLTASPFIQTETFCKYGLKPDNKIQKVMDVTVLPAECLNPCYHMIPHITNHTFAIHHFSGSWTSEKNRESLEKMREFAQCSTSGERK